MVLVLGGCTPQGVEPAVESRTSALEAGVDPGNLDILFMIDNSSSMTQLQMKMLNQDPGFMTVLQQLTNGLPNIHVAVVSSDMGAPGDATSSIGCTTLGDNGAFQYAPQGSCSATTLAAGATYISNVGGVPNYTGTLEGTFGCIAQLGSRGCGFEHQLASVDRALGADGASPPSQNQGFLRNDAVLAIVFLTNEDDCSAPANTNAFSLNVGGSNQQNIANYLGPVANYRCNGGPEGAHLCQDPGMNNAMIVPPLNPPSDATGNPPVLNLINCQDNETGNSALTSVTQFVNDIKALKPDPDNQIVVGAMTAPASPYSVVWVPEQNGQNTQPGELWPLVMHSCGAAGGDDVNPLATMNPIDGSFGDPGVRVEQFVHAFGINGVTTSICNPDYGAAFQQIANRIDTLLHHTTSTGAAGSGGGGGGSGAAGSGGSGTAGTTGSGTAGSAGSGAGGATGAAGSGTGAAGTTGSGAAGTGGHAAAGADGAATTGAAGTTGSGAAGTSGSGTAGTTGSGSAGSTGSGAAGTTGSGAAGTTGSGAAGATGSGVGGAGGHGTAGAGAGGSGPSGAAGTGPSAGGAGGASVGGGGKNGTGGTTGAAGTSGGASGGTTTSSGSGGCSCDTGGSGPSGLGLTLLAGALATVARRGRRRVLTSLASRRSRP